jgi:hypothetical protein
VVALYEILSWKTVNSFRSLPLLPPSLSQTDLNSQIVDLRSRLKDTLEIHFKNQLESGIQDIGENISPYTHFVRSQLEAVTNINTDLQDAKKKIDLLHRDIDSAFKRGE